MSPEEKDELVSRVEKLEKHVDELQDLAHGDERRGSEGLVKKVSRMSSDVGAIKETVERMASRDERVNRIWKWGAGIVSALVVLLLGVVIRLLLGLPA